MKIIFCGDMVPTQSNYNMFKDSRVEDIIGNKLLSIFNQTDEIMINLEAPITNSDDSIDKCGPNLKINPLCINGIKKIGVTIAGLSNNHIMDFGEKGLNDTIEVLNTAEIKYVGVGKTLEEARSPIIINNNEVRLGIYTCAEHEFSIAKENEAGANPFDPLVSLNDIRELKKLSSHVIVLYHGGKEYYRYPSPLLQRICRAIVEAGADLVICQHSHCIGAVESYMDSKIIYGQGNFIFDEFDDDDIYAKTSLLIECDIKDSNMRIEYIPVVRYKNGIRLASDKEHKEILAGFFSRSLEIESADFLKNNYKKFAQQYINNYLGSNIADKFIYRVVNRLCNRSLMCKWISKKQLLAMLNFVECEAHRELWIEGIKSVIKEKKR